MKIVIGDVVLIGTPDELRQYMDFIDTDEQFSEALNGEVRQWSQIKVVTSNIRWVSRNKTYTVDFDNSIEEYFIVDDEGDYLYLDSEKNAFTYIVTQY